MDILQHQVRFYRHLIAHDHLYERNRSKSEAFDGINIMTLILKTVLDAISRLLIFSIFLYVFNEGQFSSTFTMMAFYLLFSILVLFHLWFDRRGDMKSFAYWIGSYEKALKFKQFNVYV